MSRSQRGFTMLEAVVTVAVIAVVAALAYTSLQRYRPRANLANTVAELQSLVHEARQRALASGRDVLVLVFPDAVNGEGGLGRVVLYEDGNFDFFDDDADVNFEDYDPLDPKAGDRSEVLDVIDLPRGVTFGPADGLGSGATLPAPYEGVAVNVACSFCSDAGDHRGAIRFDSRGRATFHTANEASLDVTGVSLSVTSADVGGPRTLVISAGTGSVRAIIRG